MIDTVAVITDVEGVLGLDDWTLHRRVKPSGEVFSKWILNKVCDDGAVVPRLTLYPGSGKVKAEVSLPKLALGENVSLLSPGDAKGALDAVHEYCQGAVGAELPAIDDWAVCRADYCHSWDVGDQVTAYILALGGLQLGSHKRALYGDLEGCKWWARANELKVYDKAKESHLPEAEGMLRFEVRVNATGYHAEKVLRAERTVKGMLNGDAADKSLSYFWERLGADQFTWRVADPGAALLLKELFGSQWQDALGFLTIYQDFGTRAYKDFGLMSKSGYYRWRRRFRDLGPGWLDLSPLDPPGQFP